jgi:3-dehydroquinate dehydratase-1
MAQHVSSENLLLSTFPLTVGVISRFDVLQQIATMGDNAQAKLCDVIELRLDLLEAPMDEVRIEAAKLRLPILITARHPAEGGKGSEDAAERSAMLESMLDLASLMDVELRSAGEMKAVITKAQAASVQVVGSFHDFQATPADEVLTGARQMGQTLGLDGVKIATYLNSPADLIRLMQHASTPLRLPFSVMGMGPYGRVSRLALAKVGSLLNYGYLGESNAPGQWPAAQLKELLAEL